MALLKTYQTDRKSLIICEKERKTSALLQENLICMVRWCVPSDLTLGLDLEAFGEMVEECGSVDNYRGTLVGKGVRTNQAGIKAFPK